jgi:hypothetical protein
MRVSTDVLTEKRRLSLQRKERIARVERTRAEREAEEAAKQQHLLNPFGFAPMPQIKEEDTPTPSRPISSQDNLQNGDINIQNTPRPSIRLPPIDVHAHIVVSWVYDIAHTMRVHITVARCNTTSSKFTRFNNESEQYTSESTWQHSCYY